MQTQQVLGVAGGGMLFTAKSNSSKASDNSFDQLIQIEVSANFHVGTSLEKIFATRRTFLLYVTTKQV